MIDEDINERMARLVPQPGGIGEMPSQIPLGISMTPTFERPNAAPDIDTDYADAARRIADSRRTQMMSSLVNITTIDPDSAARSQKLGAQFGVGGDLAARNAEELRQRAFIDSISGRDMLRRNPVLADYIAQRQFAEIAHDDVDALAKTEQEFSKGWFARFDRPVSEVVSEGIAGIGEGFGRAVAQEEMFAIAERVSQRGGRMEVYEKAALESYRQEMAKGGERAGFLEEAAYIGTQQLTSAPRMIEPAMMGATTGGALGLVGGPAGFATVPAGMVTGATAGLVAGRFENSRRLETAMLYLDLLPELGHDSSSKIANTVGIFNAALDTGAAALVAKPFAGLLRGAVRQKVSEAIRQQTTRAALANAAKAYGIGVAGEVTTETVQELNNVIGSEIGRYLADKPMEIETEEGREAIATRLVDTFVATAMGMSIMGAPGPAGRLYVDTRAAKQGEQQAAKLQSMVKAIADNKLLARSPERLEEFAESAVEGTDSETTYVNAAVMHDILRQSGITEQEMDTVLPGVRAQLTEMQQNGIDLGNNDVTVPTAQMTVRLQKTPLLNQILPHARLSPDAMSITEVQQFEANREQLVAEARQIMETRQETDATFVAEAQAIEDRIFGEVTAAGIEGMDERAARANAQFVRDMYVTMAARMNVSPAEAERRFKYRVQGEGAPLEQADQFDQAGQRKTDTPAFRKWSREATVVDEDSNKTYDYKTGSPVVVFGHHGTPRFGFQQFEPSFRGERTGAESAKEGYFFSAGSLTATTYTRTQPTMRADARSAVRELETHVAALGPKLVELAKSDEDWKKSLDYLTGMYLVVNPAGEFDLQFLKQEINKQSQYGAAGQELEYAYQLIELAYEFKYMKLGEFPEQLENQLVNLESQFPVPNDRAGSGVYRSWLRMTNPFVVDLRGGGYQETRFSKIIRDAKEQGHDSVIIKNAEDAWYEGIKDTIFVVFDNRQIKDADRNVGTYKETANMFDQAATLDADYLAAVERGDMDTAQRMVDEAARASGYKVKAYHGLSEGTLENESFDPNRLGRFTGAPSAKLGFFFSKTPGTAAVYGQPELKMDVVAQLAKELRDAYAALFKAVPKRQLPEGSVIREELSRKGQMFYPRETAEGEVATWDAVNYLPTIESLIDAISIDIENLEYNPYVSNKTLNNLRWLESEARQKASEIATRYFQSQEHIARSMIGVSLRMEKPLRYDQKGAEYREVTFYDLINKAKKNGHDGVIIKNTYDGGDLDDVYVVFNPEQIKRNDPVTYDEQGNVVPLSRRFDITSPKVFEQAPVSPGFYSALAKAVDAIDAKSIAPSGWKERIKGLVNKGEIKQDEVDWSGLTDWLDMQEGKVTKESVAEFLKNNGMQVRRIKLDSGGFGILVFDSEKNVNRIIRFATKEEADKYADDRAQKEVEDLELRVLSSDGKYFVMWGERTTPFKSTKLFDTEEKAIKELAKERIRAFREYRKQLKVKPLSKFDLEGEAIPDGGIAKFGKGNLVLPGGENYREVLITLPLASELATTIQQPNGLWYIRWPSGSLSAVGYSSKEAAAKDLQRSIRAAKSGEQIMGMRPFMSSHWDEPNVLVHFRLNDRIDADGKRVLFVEEIQSDWGQRGAEEGFANQRAADEEELARLLKKAEEAPSESLDKQIRRLRNRLEKGTYGLPVAPFVTKTDGWLNLGLKHILLEATQGNYDRVAFVNGKQSADRYDLSKTVNEINYNKNPDGTFNFQVNLLEDQTDEFDRDNATLADVQQMFGKDVAEKMNAAKPKDVSQAKTQEQMFPRTIDNEGLKVGGSGMVEFYDNIVPLAVNKLLKKYGGKRLETIALGAKWDASAAELQEWNEDRVRETLNAGGEVYVVFRGQETLIQDENELEEYLDDVNNPTGWMFGDKLPTTTQSAFDVTPEMVTKLESGLPLFQAAAGPARGGFDPRRLTTILNKNADLSTFLHETAHFYLHVLGQMATDPAATPEIRADMDTLLSWFGIAGDTAEARLAAWNAMSIDQQRKYHEQFAYSFEVYLFDGKSPSVEMQGLFERFSSWLRRVYKSIRDDLNAIYRREFGEDLPILTGEVRQVMDRMLATEEQIKRQAAINEMKPQFQTLEQALASGMTEAEYAAYQVMLQEAMDAAVTDMTKASLRQMQWLGNARSRLLRDLQRKHDRQRKEVRDEVAEEIRLQPVYRAMEYLRTGTLINFDGETIKPEGPHRLDMEAVRNIYAGMPTPESLEAIRATGMAMPTNVAPDIAALGTGGKGMMGKDGIDPDVAAELFGYSSGDALIRALLAATPMKDAIDARTDEVMLARFSDLVDPKARDAAVQTALHNEARARFVAVELRFVAKATQPTRVLIEAARQAAREMIAGKRIVDVKPQEFIAAESRAARDAADLGKYEAQAKITGKAEYDRVRLAALAAGSTEEDAVRVAEEAQAAFVAARTAEREAEFKARFGASTVQQALIRAKRAQLYQNQLAAEALRVREEVDKGVKYLKQVLRDSNVKRMGADYADQIERILERFNLARLSAKARAERQSLVEWLAKLEQDGLVPDLAPEVIDEANRKPYQEMTVAEFRDLVEAVKQLEYIGKNAQKIKRAEEMAEFNEVRDEIVDSIKSNYTGKVTKPRTPTTAAGRRIAGMKRFLYSHLKAAAIARIFDGGKDDGPVWRYLIRTANAAGDMETRMRAEATKRLTEILAPVFKLGKMGGKGVYFPTIGQSLNREARLVIALNMGNDGNRQRLLDGEGWTLEQLTPVLESLTEAEWNAVQQVWDFLETYRPLIAAKERRLYGKEPNWVTPTPFTVRTADGKEVRLSGGYYPIKYDPVATERAETAEEAEAAKAQLRSAYTAATTRRSFTKARARQVRGRPLLYTMSGVYGGVNDVIHDLSWHEWLIQANRLMRDEKFSSTVRETYGVEAVRQLKDWIKDNAAGEQASQGAADQAASVLRRSVSAAGLGFNVVSAALQVTGFSQSIVRVGAKHIARGVALTVGSPIATFKAVNEKSSFMAERSRTQFRELNELRNMVQDESASARRLRLGTYFLMMRMQRMVDVPTWVGAYEKALEAGKDEDTAVALADQAVIDSQGGGMLKDLSAAERGGPVSKLFTVFYSYMNTVYNMGAVSTMTPRSKGRLASDYLMLFVVPVVLNYALKNALTPDVDDDEPDLEKIAKDLIAEELAFLMGMMVVVREFQNVANVVTGKETGARGYEGPAGLRGIGETMKFATQASQGEFDRAFRKSAVNMLGLATGLPSAQINRTLDGIEALAEGETENPFAPLTGVKR